MTYSIVLPAYNEAVRIGASLDRIAAHIRKRGWMAEVIVVDDGSSDDTVRIVREYAAAFPAIRLVQNPGNRGKGYSVRNGMLRAQGDYLLFTDADLSSPIEEADKLFEALARGADVAIGSRWMQPELQLQRQPVHRQIFGRLFNLAMRVILQLNFMDSQCGFKAFTRYAADRLFPLQQVERWGFDPELLFLARRQGLRVVEVPVLWSHRDGTRIQPLRDGIRMLIDMLKIRWNSITGRYTPTPAVLRSKAASR